MSEFPFNPEDYIINDENHNPDAFEHFAAQTPLYRKVFSSLVLDIVDHVNSVLEARGENQRYLAKLLKKSDSEVSKWLSGAHNLTLESVAKMSAALEVDLLVSPSFLSGYFGQANEQVVVPKISNQALKQLVIGLQNTDSQYGNGDMYDSKKLAQVAADNYSFAMAA